VIADYAPPLSSAREGLGRFRRSLLIGGLVAVTGAVAMGEVAYGGSKASTDTVVVRAGDTLWGIAASHYPQDNPADRVEQIRSVNRLASPDIHPGQTLALPPG
jgi:LysM repeat protein